jgi:hypothetical protein
MDLPQWSDEVEQISQQCAERFGVRRTQQAGNPPQD